MDSLLTAFSLDELRARRSLKWRMYEPDVLPLWIAEMDTPLAPPVRAALERATALGDTGYASLDRLATAFAGFARARYGWPADPDAMRLIPDVVRGIVEVLKLLGEPGDRVVVNTPVYPPFYMAVEQAARRIVEVPLDPAYRPDLDGLERAFASGARAYILCNPHNPSGSVFTREELAGIAELAARYRVRVLADEIHAPLVYPGAVHVPFLTLDSPAAATAVAFVSASKAWNLPGLKAALAVLGSEAPERRTLPAEVAFGTGLYGVLAGVAAFESGLGWLDALLRELDANRGLLGDLLARWLPEVVYRPPQATYLAWLDCRALDLGDDPPSVLRERGRVALAGGPAFGPAGRGFVRLNMATRPDVVTEAVRRMAAAVGRAGPPPVG